MTIDFDSRYLPRPADLAMAERHHQRWHDEVADAPQYNAAVERIDSHPRAAALRESLFGNSPYLSLSLIREPDVLRDFLEDGPEATLARLLADIEDDPDTENLMRHLRICKRRVALLIALADIAGVWPLEAVTSSLSALADKALRLAICHVLRKAHDRGDIVLPYPDEPDRDSGYIILGMGKLGGLELNYSSDIDLIILYDEEKIDYRGRRSVQDLLVRTTREIVRIIEERTADGYVFRVDLRLRPDPGSTPAAVSLLTAETYYEGFGQNWERAALIKARPVAGDLAAGENFLRFLKPFLWRKHLDFAAIADIHSIKRQINAVKGGAKIAVAGHNIKLGRGGIREIEFFTQTQQLIWGGRDPNLRSRSTCQTLTDLARAGHIEPSTAAELRDAYRFLRTLEHRLQMIDDQQTQTLPIDPVKLEHIALFAGFDHLSAFETGLWRVLRNVEGHYANLFEDAPGLTDSGGNLVFTGGESDPETLRTLEAMGFSSAETIAAEIRGWHHGHVHATRSTRAREMLTELTPRLLTALSRTAAPDMAFQRFNTFLERLPAGVPLFSLFYANPSLLDLVAEIMGNAPRLADRLERNTTLLDGVLTPGFFDPLPAAEQLRKDLQHVLNEAGNDFQEQLDVIGRWIGDQKFRVGLQTVRTLLEPEQAAHHLTDIADTALQILIPCIQADFSRLHGHVPGADSVVIAMGKMGSREMTATSDLDLILVYNAPPGIEASDGRKPLALSAYFARLTQRIITVITAPGSSGPFYEVDMRLRPSGNAGPIATSLTAFTRYHQDDAWTWEHLALTRARLITGESTLRTAVQHVIDATLRRPRDPGQLLMDVADMRRRIAHEHKASNMWEVKHLRGGLMDIEFIAQYLQLRWAFQYPDLPTTSTAEALIRQRRLGLLTGADADSLLMALHLWSAIQQILRQTVSGSFTEENAPHGLRDILTRGTGNPSFETLCVSMAERAQAVYAIFRRLIEDPAAALQKEKAS